MRAYSSNNCNVEMHRDIDSAINIGKKANILSCSDYSTYDFPKVLYHVEYSRNNQKLSFTESK